MDDKIWIVFEGIDGSGKTTQAKMLNDYLKKRGIKSLYKHIFDTETGQILKNIFLENNNLNNTTEILLLCATRQAYLDELFTINEDYDVIITDRFFGSILAMQGKNERDILLINHIKENILEREENYFTYYINTPPNECKKRLQKKGNNDRIELKSVKFHENVYKNYSKLLYNKKNVYIFDGKDEINNIHYNIIGVTQKLLTANLKKEVIIK